MELYYDLTLNVTANLHKFYSLQITLPLLTLTLTPTIVRVPHRASLALLANTPRHQVLELAPCALEASIPPLLGPPLPQRASCANSITSQMKEPQIACSTPI